MAKKTRDIPTEILARFMRASEMRYRDGRPHRVPNDLYNYHLQKLVKQGLIQKVENHYQLSAQGLQEVISSAPVSPLGKRRDVFKVCVLCCIVRNCKEGRQILLQTRLVQPWIGSITVPGGSIKRNELYATAATRKIQEEAGLLVNEKDWHFCGHVRGIKVHGDKMIQDIFFIIMGTEKFKGELEPVNMYGKNFWGTLDMAIIQDKEFSSGSYPALVEIYTALKEQKVDELTPRFGEYRIEVPTLE